MMAPPWVDKMAALMGNTLVVVLAEMLAVVLV